MITLILLACLVLLLLISAKRQVDETVATVNAERPDKEPLPANAWVDSGCLVLLLLIFVIGAVSLLGALVPLP